MCIQRETWVGKLLDISPEFNSLVSGAWNVTLNSTKMYVVVHKLKGVKRVLKELNKKGFDDVHAVEVKAFREMQSAQEEIHKHLGQLALADLEITDVNEYKRKHQIYMEFLKRKANWARHGDENSAVLHHSIRARKV